MRQDETPSTLKVHACDFTTRSTTHTEYGVGTTITVLLGLSQGLLPNMYGAPCFALPMAELCDRTQISVCASKGFHARFIVGGINKYYLLVATVYRRYRAVPTIKILESGVQEI